MRGRNGFLSPFREQKKKDRKAYFKALRDARKDAANQPKTAWTPKSWNELNKRGNYA